MTDSNLNIVSSGFALSLSLTRVIKILSTVTTTILAAIVLHLQGNYRILHYEGLLFVVLAGCIVFNNETSMTVLIIGI